MTVPGETIGTGASPRCPDCDTMPKVDIQLSVAGFFIGTTCRCGPYSRESDYYTTREQAQRAFDTGEYGR